MKFKNYKSAIHNFADSFMSIDYMKSGKLAVNVLVGLYNQGLETKATFDFLQQTIEPKEADNKHSRHLLNDYLDWLPDHFIRHDCDLAKLETLQIIISIDFGAAVTPLRRNDSLNFVVATSTTWKAEGREEEKIVITHSEIVKRTFLKSGIPEY